MANQLHHSPKLLTSPHAKQRADLHLIFLDLQHVADCCDELLKRGMRELMTVTSQALLDSAIIRYARCFTRGLRHNPIKLLENVSLEERQVHDHVLAVRDKHLAHSVNGYEMAGSTIYIAEAPGGILKRGKPSSMGSHHVVPLSLGHVEVLGTLARRLIELIELSQRELEAVLEHEVAQMSDDEVRALPDGLLVVRKIPDVREARTWPPVHGAARVRRRD